MPKPLDGNFANASAMHISFCCLVRSTNDALIQLSITFENAMPTTSRSLLISRFASIIGVLALAFAGLPILATLVIGTMLPETSGTVVAVTTTADEQQRVQPIITLRLQDGNTVMFRPSASERNEGDAGSALPLIGTSIRVVYNPSDPRMFTPLWNEPDPRIPSRAIILQSSLFMLIGLILILWGNRRGRQHQRERTKQADSIAAKHGFLRIRDTGDP